MCGLTDGALGCAYLFACSPSLPKHPMCLPCVSVCVQEGRAWVDAVMGRDFDVVIPAHASAPVRDGKIAFAGCFNFLY